MTKKGVHHSVKTASSASLEEKVIHNMVELQKVHTDLAEKFNKLSNHLEQLLTLFEVAARSFAKQTNIPGLEKDREFLDKIDRLLDQNKVIAKGLTLMEEKMRERLYGSASTSPAASIPSQRSPEVPRPLPRF